MSLTPGALAPIKRLDGASQIMAHAMSAGDLANQLNVQPAMGLAAGEALQRKDQFGPNQLPNPPQRQSWQVLAAQFKSILILILAGASGLSALIGNLKDALVILAVMLINATVGFYQEWRAEQSLAADCHWRLRQPPRYPHPCKFSSMGSANGWVP